MFGFNHEMPRHGRHGRCEEGRDRHGGHRHAGPRRGDPWRDEDHGGWERHGRRGGGRRMFDGGELRLLLLKLIADKPRHGYDLIRAIEERTGGAYAPSPGIVYPTLTMLEEEGFATSTVENNKKVYSVTSEGRQFLEENKRRIEALFERLEEAGQGFKRGRSPEIMKAFQTLRGAVIARVSRESVSEEQIAKIAAAINAAAKSIDEL